MLEWCCRWVVVSLSCFFEQYPDVIIRNLYLYTCSCLFSWQYSFYIFDSTHPKTSDCIVYVSKFRYFEADWKLSPEEWSGSMRALVGTPATPRGRGAISWRGSSFNKPTLPSNISASLLTDSVSNKRTHAWRTYHAGYASDLENIYAAIVKLKVSLRLYMPYWICGQTKSSIKCTKLTRKPSICFSECRFPHWNISLSVWFTRLAVCILALSIFLQGRNLSAAIPSWWWDSAWGSTSSELQCSFSHLRLVAPFHNWRPLHRPVDAQCWQWEYGCLLAYFGDSKGAPVSLFRRNIILHKM